MTNITIYTMDSNLIFGIRPVAEAIEAGKQIEKLYIRKGAEGQLIKCYCFFLHTPTVFNCSTAKETSVSMVESFTKT